jgi:PAS domain S-box-containing protein
MCIAGMDGYFKQLNPAFIKAIGYSEQELLARSFFDFIHPEDREATATEVKKLKTGAVITKFENRYCCRDGSYKWLEWTASPDVESELIYAIARDITERKEREEYLRVDRKKYELFIDSVKDYAIFSIDVEGIIISWNSGAEKFFGYSENEIVGQQFAVLFTPEDRENKVPEWELSQAEEAGKAPDNRWHLRKDDKRIFVAGQIFPIRDRTGELIGYTKIIRDLTERKQAEAEAQEQRHLLKAVTDNASVALFIMDDRQQCVFMNPAAETMTGFTIAEVRSRSLHDIIHHTRPDGSHYPLEECPIDRAFPQNNRERGEEVFVRPEGSFYHVSYTASPIRNSEGISGTIIEVRDITQEKQAEARFRLMADSISQLAWMANPDGWIFWYNQRWYEYTGTTPEAMEGWGWQSVHDPHELPKVLERWQGSINKGEPFEMEFPLKRADGEFRWFLTRANPMKDVQGKVVFWFGTNTDISEQRQLTEERAKLLEVERAARAEAERVARIKDEFLAVLSHELRTPLNAIVGWSSMLLSNKLDEASKQNAIFKIDRNAKLQTQLIDDLLDISQILQGKLNLKISKVNLENIVTSAIETVRLAAEAKSIQLETVLASDELTVRGDATRLQQVVWNLLTNAIKFTPHDGRITVRLQQVDKKIELVVSDTGKGINPEFLPHVFEYFRQEDSSITRRFGGLGLGLAIVKHIVELHGGTIRVESAGYGMGATFTVELPLIKVKQPKDKDGDRFEPTLNLKGMKILAIDDEADSLEILSCILNTYGADVSAFTSANQALLLLDRIKPDLLISDIGMPEMDGLSLIREIRTLSPERGGEIRAIALTAYASQSDRKQVLAAGYEAYLAKPIDLEKLVGVLARFNSFR